MVKMKNLTEQDQNITKDLEKYQLAPPSPNLHDRVLRAAREAMANSNSEPGWIDRRLRQYAAFSQEILAFASAVMLVLGLLMQLAGGQSVLADSIERLKAMSTVSSHLHRAISMDCNVLKPSAGAQNSRYRVRWNTDGVTRVDVAPISGKEQTLWISNETVSVADNEGGTMRSIAITNVPSEWQPPMEFLNPTTLAQHMKERYGSMRSERQDGVEPQEFLLVGQEDHMVVEISVGAKSYLPTTLRKYSSGPARTGKDRDCIEEVRFQWNKPIPLELLVPGLSAVKRKAD
jgi:hypothetical protein